MLGDMLHRGLEDTTLYKVFSKDKLRYYTEKPSHFSCRIVCQNYLVDFR